jgi:hypothetical protein
MDCLAGEVAGLGAAAGGGNVEAEFMGISR